MTRKCHVRFGGGRLEKARQRDLAGRLPYLPWRAWSEFEREFNGAQAHLQTALDAYEDNYDAIRDTVLSTFRQLAADSARRLVLTMGNGPLRCSGTAHLSG